MKLALLALFIGRFQPFHNAHLVDIKNILKESDEIIIAIGSSQKKNTLENPFSYNERKQMIVETLKKNKIKNYKIYPVPDFKENIEWVNYLKAKLPRFDIAYSGNDYVVKILNEYRIKTKKIRLIKGINSTRIRGLMLKGNSWQKLVPKEVINYIKKIKGVERIKKIYY